MHQKQPPARIAVSVSPDTLVSALPVFENEKVARRTQLTNIKKASLLMISPFYNGNSFKHDNKFMSVD
jgi:hypothetical protein